MKTNTSRKLLLLLAVLAMTLVLGLCLVACNSEDSFTNPGDSLGGGGTVSDEDTPTETDTSSLETQIAALDTTITTEEQVTSADGLTTTTVNLSELTTDYTITAAGNYVFSGTTTHRIVLGVKGAELHIFLNNATFDSIYSDKKPTSTIITLNGTNVLTGLLSDTNDDAKGTLYVKNALTINGSGTIKVTSASKNAIHCTGILKLVDTTVTAVAQNHGIRGNDAVIISGSTVKSTATAGDGIQTDNETDSTEVGYIYIEDSSVTVNAGDDGIQAATYLTVVSGTINVTSVGKGIKAGTISYEVASDDLATEQAKDYVTVTQTSGVYTAEITDGSYYAIVIKGGTFTMNCTDDALHSNGYMFISGGTLAISTGDDGIHADDFLGISGGTINITKSYEGIESAKIEISGGTISVVSSDDGVNAADGTSTQVGVGNSNCYLIVSGGYLRINASGDGLDSNGTMLISGGEVYVDGPTSNGDAALDSDGGILVNGGTLVAVGSMGMVETPATNSEQYVVSYATSSTISAGSTLELRDSDGNVLISFTTAKSCQSVIMSCSGITNGGTYTIWNNSVQLTSFTVSSKITSVGTSSTGGDSPSQPGGGNWGFNKR